MAITAQELITRTYLLLNAVDSGEDPTTDESSDGLLALNEMLANWAEQTISVPFRTEDQIALTQGKNEYSWGTGGDINSDRPVEVQSAWLETADGSSYGFDIGMRLREYSQVALKGSSGRPVRGWYETSYPLGTLTLDTKPDAAYTLYVWSIKQFTEFSTLSAESVLPTSYTRVLRFNLAMEIGPELGVEIDPRVVKIAGDSFRAVKNGNLARRVNNLSMDNALRGRGRRQGYDIRTG